MEVRLRVVSTLLLAVLLSSPVWLLQAGAQTPSSAPPQQRPTSEPYTGDLSIFETPGRDQRLQIDRVMDILGIKNGKTVADIGARCDAQSADLRRAGNGNVVAVQVGTS